MTNYKSMTKEGSVRAQGRSQAALILGEVCDLVGFIGAGILAFFGLAQLAK